MLIIIIFATLSFPVGDFAASGMSRKKLPLYPHMRNSGYNREQALKIESNGNK